MQIALPFYQQKKEMKEAPPITGKYKIILIDPPWRYDFSKSNKRKIENHYPTLTIEEIKAIKIPAEKDTALFLWTTSPKLPDALSVINEWGFTYKATITWVKTGAMGCGYWARQDTEFLLISTKGNIKPPAPENRHSSVVHAKRGKHSEKPKEVYKIIETMYPNENRIELFARHKQPGWHSWGNEV